MRLDLLLGGVDVLEERGNTTVDVTAVTHDSRAVQPGALFCCVPGATADGHDHAPSAVEAGAVALLCERLLDLDVAQVRVPAARPAMAEAAAAFWGHPSRHLSVCGVTGTNGKTTTTHLLRSILEAAGQPTEVIGTLSGARTTPEAPELQERLASARAGGATAVSMEVSSHALVQHRVDAVTFRVAAFTNLSPDHLDFHGDMESYFEAKALLFTEGRSVEGVVNADDAYGRRLLDRAPIPMRPYSLDDATDVELSPSGSRFRWRGAAVRVPMGGAFNVANALCAATIAACLDVDPATVAEGLAVAPPVAGRYEPVDAGQPYAVIVDYAHTPDGLDQLLRSVRADLGGQGRLIVVFGCGGDRDQTKRPAMGRIAAAMADVAVITSDNPRSEDPEAIIESIMEGVRGGPAKAEVVADRTAAIARAVELARPGDAVVIAGKGHETGQTTAGVTVPFDDREVARGAIEAAG